MRDHHPLMAAFWLLLLLGAVVLLSSAFTASCFRDCFWYGGANVPKGQWSRKDAWITVGPISPPRVNATARASAVAMRRRRLAAEVCACSQRSLGMLSCYCGTAHCPATRSGMPVVPQLLRMQQIDVDLLLLAAAC